MGLDSAAQVTHAVQGALQRLIAAAPSRHARHLSPPEIRAVGRDPRHLHFLPRGLWNRGGIAERRSLATPAAWHATCCRHGYALLHEILGQERQLSKLGLIKTERKPLETVIDSIAETCDAAYDQLEDLAGERPQLDLSDTGLPADEVLTRQAIAATRRDQLLAASGREFELQLLWSQNEALTYASHLADTLARSEADPARLAFVRALWKDLVRLDEDVRALLRHSSAAAR